MKIDFNSDLAEGMGVEKDIMPIISSANISCALHAGSIKDTYNTLLLAKQYGVRVGAHPSFDDRKNFGRENINLSKDELKALLLYQLGAFKELCNLAGVKMSYVKPHGALYNMACVDYELAKNIVMIVKNYDSSLSLMGLSNSYLIKACDDFGLNSISEVFADRRYQDNGMLVSRTKTNALITNEDEAINQVLNMVKNSYVISENNNKISIKADSICIHGDGAKALEFANKIKSVLNF